jgi:outer membrane protein assembly factor BamB
MRSRLFFATIMLLTGPAIWMAAQQPSPGYTQWRGQNRDGSASAFVEPKTWPETLTKRWSTDVGTGYATPLVVGDRLYVFSRQGDNEVMSGLDAATGKMIWETSHPVSFTMNKGAARHGQGPKSTPAYADGQLFSIGMTGVISAYDAKTGKELWRKPGSELLPMLKTGKSLWTSGPRQAGQAAVVKAGAVVFSLEDDGELVVARVGTTGFEPLRRYKLADSETWTQPAISGNRLFVKDVSTLTLWTIP